MQKVLLISYFFHPCNFVGAERVNYWSNNLYKYGIYPIIVTRCWNNGQKDIIGTVISNKYKKEKNDKREIHYLDYKLQIRDYFSKIILIRKLLTLFQQTLFYIFPRTLNYYNIYLKSHQILKNNPDIKTIIVSLVCVEVGK